MSRLIDAARSEPAPALTPEARARIAGELAALGAPGRPRRSSRIAAVTAIACVAAVVAFFLGRQLRPTPATPAVATQEIVVPACNVVRVSEAGRFSAAIVGPARVTLSPRAAVPFVVHEGHLVARTDEALPVATPGGQVTASRGGVDIEVHDGREVRISAFAAQAQALIDGSEPLVPSCIPAAPVEEPPVPAPAQPPAVKRIHEPPAPPAPAPAAPSESRPPDPESQLLADALRLARQSHDGAGALARLDELARRFPTGALAGEAMVVRVEVLLSLGRGDEALALLEATPLSTLPRPRELLVLRGDLRADHGKSEAAERDYSAALAGGDDAIGERALWGRASSRSRRGDAVGARADLMSYVDRFPRGRFADAARRALAEP